MSSRPEAPVRPAGSRRPPTRPRHAQGARRQRMQAKRRTEGHDHHDRKPRTDTHRDVRSPGAQPPSSCPRGPSEYLGHVIGHQQGHRQPGPVPALVHSHHAGPTAPASTSCPRTQQTENTKTMTPTDRCPYRRRGACRPYRTTPHDRRDASDQPPGTRNHASARPATPASANEPSAAARTVFRFGGAPAVRRRPAIIVRPRMPSE